MATVLSPRSALPILGKLLAWAREQKSKDDWLTPPQVAKMMGVKPDKILYWIHTGQLPAVNVAKKEGGRPQYAVTPAGLDIFTTRRSTRPPVKVKRARPKSSGRFTSEKPLANVVCHPMQSFVRHAFAVDRAHIIGMGRVAHDAIHCGLIHAFPADCLKSVA